MVVSLSLCMGSISFHVHVTLCEIIFFILHVNNCQNPKTLPVDSGKFLGGDLIICLQCR